MLVNATSTATQTGARRRWALETDAAGRSHVDKVAWLGAAIVRADTVIHETEVRALEDCLVRLFGLSVNESRELTRRVLDAKSVPAEDDLIEPLAGERRLDRLLLLDAMIAIATVDGVLHRGEREILERLREKLDVSSSAYIEMLLKWGAHTEVGNVRGSLASGPVTIGRGEGNTIQLRNPSVSRNHARIVQKDDSWILEDLDSPNGTWVNGRRERTRVLENGDLVRVENFCIRVDLRNEVYSGWDTKEFAVLAVDGLSVGRRGRRRKFIRGTRRPGSVWGAASGWLRRLSSRLVSFSDRNTVWLREGAGAPVPLLQRVSFSMFSGELVAVIGPSGCGKTTLINAVVGNIPLERGRVLLNGETCEALVRERAARVGIVPQDDIVHRELTVEESLRFSASLRFAPDVSRSELDKAVDSVIHTLSLESIRGARIGDLLERGISGGERKRVNLGQELLNPTTQILVLDEPTTGLDPHRGIEILRMLRGLANEGRLVIVVTHLVDEMTLSLFDSALVLAGQGREVFFGPPAEALRFIGSGTVPDMFVELSSPDRADSLAQRFRRSSEFDRFVRLPRSLMDDRSSSTPLAKPSRRERRRSARPGTTGPSLRAALQIRLRQFLVLVHRYFHVKARDPAALLVTFLQVPVVVLCCWLVLRDGLVARGDPVVPAALPFVLVIAAFWLGCFNGVREIVAERAIYRRERLAGLKLVPYLSSKLVVLFTLTAIQAAALILLCDWAFGLGERLVDVARAGAILGLVGCLGVAVGLALSAYFRTAEAAIKFLPFVVIPQLLFGGLLAPFDGMPDGVQAFSYMMASRWGVNGFLESAEPGGAGEDCTLFALPSRMRPGARGHEQLCRNDFREMLGLSELSERSIAHGARATHDFRDSLVALSILLLLSTLLAGAILRARPL